MRDNFVYGREFLGDGDLNAQALLWMDQTANPRVHGTTHEVPRERFERDEREVLQALPAGRYTPLVLPPHRLTRTAPAAGGTRARPPTVEVERRPLAAYTRNSRARTRTHESRRASLREQIREQIRTQLADLKMSAALEALDDILRALDGGSVQAPAAIERLLGAQIALRNNRRLQAAMRSSRLPAVKTLGDFDFTFQPSLKREQIGPVALQRSASRPRASTR